jgi:inorganic triphosphatase YgiF
LELKLAIPDGTLDAVLHRAAIRASTTQPPRQRREFTTYFDTRDRALAQCGVSLRVRCADGRRVQTLKADRRSDVAADRAEWEWSIDRDRPDPTLLRQTEIGRNLPAGPELEQVLATDIERTVRVLELGDGTIVEAALDEGSIIAGDAREPVRELELELQHGDPAAIYRLALALHASAPVTLVYESKAARGYRLLTGGIAGACKAEHVVVDPETSSAETFGRIVAAGLGHLLANRPAALSGDAEGVHQMRVAIRRLGAALTFFRPDLETNATSRFEAELRRMGQVFGEARDWNVFCLQILPDALASQGAAGWRDFLEQPAAARREAAHLCVAQEIRAPSFTALVIGLAAWAEQGRNAPDMLGDDALTRPIEELCPRLLTRVAHKVKQRGRHIERRSDVERHALRKALKKLRYGIDYVATVYPQKSARPYLQACKKLQRVLGDINDTVAATALADRLAEGSRPDLAPAASALATQLAKRRSEALRRLPKRWHAFRAQPHFWA